MKQRNYLRKAAFLIIIGLVGSIGCVNSTKVAKASVTDGSLITAEAATDQTITADAETSDLYPISVQTEGDIKYGYIDGTGKTIIQPIYTYAENFSEGFAVVSADDKYQIINEKGEVIFKTEGTIQALHNGLAAFSDPQSYKSGYVNTQGKVVIKPKYDYAGSFHTDQTAFVTKSGKYYKINNNGKVLKTYQLMTKYNCYDVTDDGYVICSDPKTFLQGVLTLNGKVILKPIYGQITYLESGLFSVKKALSDYEAYLINIKPAAIFNKNGKRLTSYQYYDLSEFQGDYASATDSKYTYFINKNGQKVTTLPKLEGRGTMQVLGDVIQADIDNEMIYLKEDGTLIWKKDDTTHLASGITINTVKLRPNKYVVVNYPKLADMSDASVQNSINNKLETIFTKNRKNLKEKDYLSVDDTFTVSQIKDILIINKNGYDYPIGAAHGTPLCNYYFINIKTGDFYQLKDLFKSDSDYAVTLSKLITKQMKINTKNGDMVYFDDSNDMISNDQYFYISEDTLTIYYDCGTITAYAAGFPKFEIPFQDIMSIVNTDGAFWKAFH